MRAESKRISLGGAAARGGATWAVANTLEAGTQFFRAALLARVLSPGDFGLMGMALVVMQAGESLSQTGMTRALVVKGAEAEDYLDTVFVITALRGAILTGLLMAVAPLAGLFFSTPSLVPLMRVISLVFLLNGLISPAIYVLERDLRFARFAVPRVSGTLVDLLVAVPAALVLRSAWAMVIGYLAGRFIWMAASYVAAPYRPSVRGFSLERARDLYGYGKHVTRATAVDYFISQSDKALVGRLMGVDALGLYGFAWRIATLPVTAATNVAQAVAFPLFSRVQSQRERMRSGYLRALGTIAAISAPLTAGVFAIATELVAAVFGPKWAGMTTSLRVLCLGGACMALFNLLGAIVAGSGRPEIGARGSYVYLIFVVVPIYPAVRFGGPLGAAICMSVASLVAVLYLGHQAGRLTGSAASDVVRVMAGPIGAAVVMAGCLAGFHLLANPAPTLALVAAEVAAGAVIYVPTALLLDRRLGAGLLDSFRSAWKAA